MSGGDPLLVPDKELDRILGELRSIPHLEILRIGTRVPGTLTRKDYRKPMFHIKKISSVVFQYAFQSPQRN